MAELKKAMAAPVTAVELATEAVEGVLQPAPKGPSLVTIKPPIHITGTLKHIEAELAKSTKYTLLGKTAVVDLSWAATRDDIIKATMTGKITKEATKVWE